MVKKILFLSSANLTTNPRIYKELQLANKLNHQITFVGFKLGNWSDEGDEIIKKEFPSVKFIYLDATRHNYFEWLYFSLLHVFCKWLWPLKPASLWLTAAANSKRTIPLLRLLLSLSRKKKYDLVIAHTLPALYPSLKLMQTIKCSFAFDVEDFHPGEGNDSRLQKNIARLMKIILPQCVYVSFASPLIKEYTNKLLGKNNSSNFITVNNTFSIHEFSIPTYPNSKNKLQLVWFSQYIDYNRGLEKFLPLLDKYNDKIELTLIGEIRKVFFDKELSSRNYIYCKSSLPQKHLHALLSKYDIGLAIEDKTFDLNRNICLTNKIWAYFQAGLYILSSDTKAQNLFINQHVEHGECISLEKTIVEKSMEVLIKDKELIRSSMHRRYENAKKYCWENESELLKKEWKILLN